MPRETEHRGNLFIKCGFSLGYCLELAGSTVVSLRFDRSSSVNGPSSSSVTAHVPRFLQASF